MSRSGRTNALLVEIMLAALFFALSATVILRCFAAAREQANLADARDRALLQAQNAAAALYAAEDPEAALREMGFREDGGWTLEGDGWTLAVALGEEAAPAGALRMARIAASAGGEALFELPLAKYVAEEAAR